MTHETRESWLLDAAQRLAPILEQAGVGLADVRVSCGWPSTRALSTGKRRLGECWHASANGDGTYHHIFISPCVGDPLAVLGHLLHELIHAALPVKAGHKAEFARYARAAGLEGKPTATTVGEQLAQRLNTEILPTLGLYPHHAIDGSRKPKQSTRLRLYVCACPVKVRVASDTFAAHCDECGEAFVQRFTKTRQES